ncbi:hypothetical protein PRIPAC_91202 [Pristionchus pacificus]|nr:hypothetical protein PRIPAC_91202 [Pristionchus pacificus]
MRKDMQKKTPEDLARIKGKIEIVNFLKEVSDNKWNGRSRPYLTNLRLHKSSELLNMKGELSMDESSQHTYVEANVPRALSVYSSGTDEGVYSDYQYPHLTPRFHSTQTLYYL